MGAVADHATLIASKLLFLPLDVLSAKGFFSGNTYQMLGVGQLLCLSAGERKQCTQICLQNMSQFIVLNEVTP